MLQAGETAPLAQRKSFAPRRFLRPRPGCLRHALAGAERLPTLRMGAWVLAILGAALLLVREFAAPLQAVPSTHPRLAVLNFVATSVAAVLVPLLSNLALVPLVVLAWGPVWTALFALEAWVIGAAASFALGRHAHPLILRHCPSVNRLAGKRRQGGHSH